MIRGPPASSRPTYLTTMRSRTLTFLVPLLVVALAGCAAGDPAVSGAQQQLNDGEYDLALTSVEAALATDPDNVDLLLLKSEALRLKMESGGDEADIDARDFSELVATLDRLQRLAPDNARVRDARLAAWALAVNTGNSIIRDTDAEAQTALPFLTAATELQPDSTQGYLSLGLAYFRTGEAALAVPPLERAAQLNPDDPVLAYYQGRALVLADRGTEAVTVLEAAQTRFPGNEDIQTMLLNAYTSTGQREQALERYASAARSQPDNAVIRYNYGALLLQDGQFDEAIVELRAATELQPDNADAFYNLGAAFQNKAAELNTRGNETDDVAAADALFAERDENLELALGPLVQARQLATASNDEQGFCEALFRVYTQLNRIDDAEGVAECAGMSMN